MISLNKCTRSYNALSPKICVPKETKVINVKTLNMIANKDKAKAMREHFSCDSKCKLNSTTCKSKQQWNNKICQYECNNYRKGKKDYNWNPSTCIYVNSSYLKIIASYFSD